jgi:hypothetical protein
MTYFSRHRKGLPVSAGLKPRASFPMRQRKAARGKTKAAYMRGADV